MATLSLIAVLVGLAMAGPASAATSTDPLLSGYSGPGGGEQALLGSRRLPPGGGGGGASTAAPGSASLAVTPSSRATTGAAPAGTTTSRASRDRRSSGHRDARGAAGSGSIAATPVAAAPARYPSRAGAVGDAPLSVQDLVLAMLAALVLVLVGLGLRRLGSGAEARS